MDRLSWQTKLMGLITLVLGGLLLFQLLYVVPYIENREVEMTMIHQEEIARNIARELNIDLLRIKNRLTRITERAEFRNMDVVNQTQVMVQHEEISFLLASLFVMDAQGWFVSSSVEDLSPYTTKSYADQPFFAAPFEQGEVYFAPPRFYPSMGLVGTSVNVPIVSETGERVGVLMGGMMLHNLMELVEDYPLEEGQVAFVVDREGTVVAHSGMDLLALEEGPLSLDYSEWPMVQAVMAGEKGGSQKYEHNGLSYFGTYTILESNGWGVVVEAPVSAILAESRALTGRLLAANIVLFAIALGVALVISWQIMAEQRRAESHRVAALDALRESEEKLSQIVQGIPVPAFVIDNDHITTHWNKACETLTGIVAGDVIGTQKQWSAFYSVPRPVMADLIMDTQSDEEIARHYGDRYRKSAVMEGAYEAEDFFTHLGEGGKWLFFSAAQLTEVEGNVIGAIETLQDITERKRLEEQLLQAHKMEAVGLLAGGVAHDFNNMLAGILGYANMLKLRAEPASFTHDAAVSIEKAAERAAELTAQLLGFARRGKHRDVTVDLHQTIHEVIGLLSHTIDKNIAITQRLQAKTPTTRGDPGQMQQVILNLAINARDAMPQGGELTFETEVVNLDEEYCRTHLGAVPGDYLMVSVIDTGYGIAKEHLERIFDPFFTTKEAGQGTGMGLAMVYGIVKNHDGYIAVDSQVGQGVNARVYLPLEEEAVAVTETPQAVPIHGTGRILLVDDEEVVREMAGEMLRALGYEVVTAVNGKEAVDAYRDLGSQIDLVIIDMIMPEMGGRECFRQIKELDPNVRAVLSTGHGLDKRAQQIMDEGVQGFVQKPYLMGQLAQVVGEAIASSGGPG